MCIHVCAIDLIFTFPDLSLQEDCYIYDRHNTQLVGCICKNVISEEQMSRLEVESEKLIRSAEKVHKSNCRGKAVQLHYGFWGKHSHTKNMYETKDSRNPASKLFHLHTRDIWTTISDIINLRLPDQYKHLQAIKERLGLPYTWGLWHTLAYNVGLSSESHIDTFDDKAGVAVIVPVGHFLGGDVQLNDFAISCRCNRRDIFIIWAALYTHQNSHVVDGDRNSIILFNDCCAPRY